MTSNARRTCPHCGKGVAEDRKRLCNHCGEELGPVEEQGAPSVPDWVRFCAACGQPRDTGALLCSQCGAPFPEASSRRQPQGIQTEDTRSAGSSPLATAVLVVVMLGLAVWFFMGTQIGLQLRCQYLNDLGACLGAALR